MQNRYCVRSGKKKITDSKFKKPSHSPYSKNRSKKQQINDSSNEDIALDCNRSNVEGKRKLQVSKTCISLAIEILKQIDPEKKMKKEEVIICLKDNLDKVNDLAKIQAIEYLLDSFENLEEKLEEFSQYRQVQEKKLSAIRLDDEVFTARINLDSDEREPDENDRIFTLGKKVFSGCNQKYKKVNPLEERKTMKIMMPKNDFRKLKNYNI